MAMLNYRCVGNFFWWGRGSKCPSDLGVPRLAVASEVALCCLGSQDDVTCHGHKDLFNVF